VLADVGLDDGPGSSQRISMNSTWKPARLAATPAHRGRDGPRVVFGGVVRSRDPGRRPASHPHHCPRGRPFAAPPQARPLHPGALVGIEEAVARTWAPDARPPGTRRR